MWANVIMKYKTKVTLELSIFLESFECTNCISPQDMKFLILLPPFFLFEKYIPRQEEIPQVYGHFITKMAFLFIGYVRMWLLDGKTDDSSPSRTEVRIHGAIPIYHSMASRNWTEVHSFILQLWNWKAMSLLRLKRKFSLIRIFCLTEFVY
jgi:hypothetical protein